MWQDEERPDARFSFIPITFFSIYIEGLKTKVSNFTNLFSTRASLNDMKKVCSRTTSRAERMETLHCRSRQSTIEFEAWLKGPVSFGGSNEKKISNHNFYNHANILFSFWKPVESRSRHERNLRISRCLFLPRSRLRCLSSSLVMLNINLCIRSIYGSHGREFAEP